MTEIEHTEITNELKKRGIPIKEEDAIGLEVTVWMKYNNISYTGTIIAIRPNEIVLLNDDRKTVKIIRRQDYMDMTIKYT